MKMKLTLYIRKMGVKATKVKADFMTPRELALKRVDGTIDKPHHRYAGSSTNLKPSSFPMSKYIKTMKNRIKEGLLCHQNRIIVIYSWDDYDMYKSYQLDHIIESVVQEFKNLGYNITCNDWSGVIKVKY